MIGDSDIFREGRLRDIEIWGEILRDKETQRNRLWRERLRNKRLK